MSERQFQAYCDHVHESLQAGYFVLLTSSRSSRGLTITLHDQHRYAVLHWVEEQPNYELIEYINGYQHVHEEAHRFDAIEVFERKLGRSYFDEMGLDMLAA